jgi:DNA-binding XRE family transcriptional regulator
MKPQIIERDGRPEWAVIPYAEYLQLLERLEDAEDLRAYDRAKAELSAGDNESIPAVVVDRLSTGESPLRVWREHRGLTQQALADATGLGKSYVSQLESGTKTGTISTLRALAQTLQVELDDLTPWPQDR